MAPATRNLVDVYPAYRPKKRGAGTVLVGLFIAAAGVAGAYAIVTRQGVEPMDAIKRMIATLHPSEAAPANASFTLNHDGDPKPAAVMAGQPGSGPTTPRTTGVQISTLPPASAAAGTNAPGAIAKNTLPPPVVVAAKAPVAKPAEKQAAAPVEKTAAPVEKAAPPEPPPVAPPEPAGPPGLVGAIKKAAGPIEHAPVVKEPEPTPEKPVSNGEIPEAPAQGAIQGAIGAQRGAARACLDGQTTPSRATLVFGSNGKVQSVSVSGSAAGNGAETCIKRAMSRASVGPFSRPTFQVSVSISPP